ncbi:zinc-binding dehydrogenase [Streptomyces sp. TP-A0356]|uniref:zinc-binding dehydrogenase n=1 Tax=Streptomyces sp. TP-A0356 TaxID=1359208 RepID=UPI001F44B0F8|nr:zinc-binding dehydrogenase [Streptomyces sp. TP-A0356]
MDGHRFTARPPHRLDQRAGVDLGRVPQGGGGGAETFSSGGPRSVTALAEHARLAAAGRLVVRIARSRPLADAAEAQRESETGHPRGKLILRP